MRILYMNKITRANPKKKYKINDYFLFPYFQAFVAQQSPKRNNSLIATIDKHHINSNAKHALAKNLRKRYESAIKIRPKSPVKANISQLEHNQITHYCINRRNASSRRSYFKKSVMVTLTQQSSHIPVKQFGSQQFVESQVIPGVKFKGEIELKIAQSNLKEYESKNSTGYQQHQRQRRKNIEQIILRKCSNFHDLIVEYYRRANEHAGCFVFVFDSQDHWLKKALLKRGWVENLNKNSRAYHFRWGYHLPKDKPYVQQLSNHYPNSDLVTSKSGLHNSLRKHGFLDIMPFTFEPKEYLYFVKQFRKRQFLKQLGKFIQTVQFDYDPQYKEKDQLIQQIDQLTKQQVNPQETQIHSLLINALKIAKNMIFGRETPYEPYFWQQLSKQITNVFQLSEKDQMIIMALMNVGNFLGKELCLPRGKFRSVRNYWITKSKTSSKGAGLTVCENLQQISKKASNRLIQQYISDPLLLRCIDYHKFDIRVWVLLKGGKNASLFYFTEFYGRICSQRYSQEAKQLRNQAMHLTNYHINRQQFRRRGELGKSVVFSNQIFDQVSRKFKINFEQKFYQDLQNILKKLKIVFLKELCDISNNYFELFGLDLILDQRLNLKLLQINLSPRCQQRHPKLTSMLDLMSEGIIDIVINESSQAKGWKAIV